MEIINEKKIINSLATKEDRENIILRFIFRYEEFYIKIWDKKMEEKYKIPKASIYNLINSLEKQDYIVKKSKKPFKVAFSPIIKEILLIIEENIEIPIKELRKRYNDIDLSKIIDRLTDAEILDRFPKHYDIYLKIIR